MAEQQAAAEGLGCEWRGWTAHCVDSSLELNFMCHPVKGKNTFSLYSHFWHQMCGFFSIPCTFPILGGGCLDFLQLNSTLTLTVLSQHRPHRSRAQSHKTASTSDASHKSQVDIWTSDWLTINWGLLQPPPQVQWFAGMAHRTQESTLLTITGSLWRMIKDTHGQPGEEIHGVRSGRVLSTGVSVPVEFGVHHPQGHGCVLVHQPGSFLSPFD